MAKLTLEDLKKIKEQTAKSTSLRDGDANVKITVHMATCGIAAGAREVMKTLVDEIARADRPDIQVASSRCISRCDTEPNITVEIHGQEPVIYQKMTSAKMKQVFKEHVLEGETQSEFMLI